MTRDTKILIVIDKLGKIDGKLIDLHLPTDEQEIENLLTNRFRKYSKRIDFVIVMDMVAELCYLYNFPQQQYQVTDLEGLTNYYEECIDSDNVSFYKHNYIDFKSYVQTNILNDKLNRYFGNIDYTIDQMFEVLYNQKINTCKNIFPGYIHDDNQYEDEYLFETEDIATEECFTLLQMFDSMPDEIELFRTMVVDNIDDLDIDDLGNYWSFNKNSAIRFAGNNLTTENAYLFSGTIEKQFINWEITIFNYCQNSMLNIGDEEDEIYVLDNQEHNVENITWKKLSERMIENIDETEDVNEKTITFDFTELEHVFIDSEAVESIYQMFNRYEGNLRISINYNNVNTDNTIVWLNAADADEMLVRIMDILSDNDININISEIDKGLIYDKLVVTKSYSDDSVTLKTEGDGLWHYNPYETEDEENTILGKKINDQKFDKIYEIDFNNLTNQGYDKNDSTYSGVVTYENLKPAESNAFEPNYNEGSIEISESDMSGILQTVCEFLDIDFQVINKSNIWKTIERKNGLLIKIQGSYIELETYGYGNWNRPKNDPQNE